MTELNVNTPHTIFSWRDPPPFLVSQFPEPGFGVILFTPVQNRKSEKVVVCTGVSLLYIYKHILTPVQSSILIYKAE